MSLQAKSINLKTLLYIFIIIDIGVIFTFNWVFIVIVIPPQVTVILGYLAGVRREGLIRACLMDLTGIAVNDKMTEDERFHSMTMGLHHWNLEFGYFFEELNRKYRFAFTQKPPYLQKGEPNKKPIKNNKVKGDKKPMKISEEAIKELLYFVAGVWLFAIPGIWDLLWISGWRLAWIIFICGVLIVGDFLFFWYLKNFWDIEKKDIPPINPIPS